jgi:hypothetical protein
MAILARFSQVRFKVGFEDSGTLISEVRGRFEGLRV